MQSPKTIKLRKKWLKSSDSISDVLLNTDRDDAFWKSTWPRMVDQYAELSDKYFESWDSDERLLAT